MIIQQLLNNIGLIFSSMDIAIDFISCTALGLVSFLGATKLCGKRGVFKKALKYGLAIISIILISKSFLYLVAPELCIVYSPAVLISEMALGFVFIWTLLEESFNFERSRNSKSIRIK